MLHEEKAQDDMPEMLFCLYWLRGTVVTSVVVPSKEKLFIPLNVCIHENIP